jgi:hypothetical protein
MITSYLGNEFIDERVINTAEDNPRQWGVEISTSNSPRMDSHSCFMELHPDHVFGSNESMRKGSPLGRQYLNLKGIIGVLDLIRTTKLKGYKVCTTRAVILESFLLD